MSATTRRAVLVSAVDPYPSDSGKSVVVAGFLRHLRERLGAEQVHYVHAGRAVKDQDAFEGVTVHEVGRPTRHERLAALAREAVWRRRSLQESFLASPSVACAVREALGQIDADLEIVDTIRMAQYVRDAPSRGRRILYLDDLFSVRYRRMLDLIGSGAEESSFDPLGQFASNIPGPLRGLTRHPVSRKMLLELEASRVQRSEVAAARTAATSVLLNDDEARLLSEMAGVDVQVLLPWIPQRPAGEYSWGGAADFVFIGLLSLPHNHDGLVCFLRQGMPELLARRPDARLHVVGRDASPALQQEIARHGDRVVLHGFVPDLDEAMMTCAALVNPLRFGSGVKIKTLDALARGVPVVATAFGAEGVASTSAPGLRIVADAAEAGRRLAELADPQVRERESQGARAYYQDHLSDGVVRARYDEVFGTLPA